jgi:hypothetical protein
MIWIAHGPKKAVNTTGSEDLVREARALTAICRKLLSACWLDSSLWSVAPYVVVRSRRFDASRSRFVAAFRATPHGPA